MLTPVRWTGDTLVLLDQRALPAEITYLHCRKTEEVIDAIATLAVRGAPAIGVAAAYGMLLLWREMYRTAENPPPPEKYRAMASALANARPTAVNLQWAVRRMTDCYQAAYTPTADRRQLWGRLHAEAVAVETEDVELNRRIATYGADLFTRPVTVLTHCNAGALATAGVGTALGVVRELFARGNLTRLFIDETRPLLQGSRLTAFEMCAENIPCTLICDNMAAMTIKKEKIDAVIVGADRIAANGDTANKIGTYGLAVLAAYHHIPLYVAAPSSTFDFMLKSGEDIVIEERNAEEIRTLGGLLLAPPDVPVYNPAFDVTPGELISAIITEKGVLTPPYSESIHSFRKQVT